MSKLRSIVLSIVFFLVIGGLALAHILLPDGQTSRWERRKLAQAPVLSSETFFSGEFSTDLEDYLLDQFPLRQELRTYHSLWRQYALQQLDNNDIFLYEGAIHKLDNVLDETNVRYAAKRFSEIIASLPKNCKAYYSVIPDKNAFVTEEVWQRLDSQRLLEILQSNMTGGTYIDIWPTLSLEDYYRTDLHWKQESIYDTAQVLGQAMGVELTPFESYTPNTLEPFYGAYYGQAALPIAPDQLVYMTSPFTSVARVTSAEYAGVRPVYIPENINAEDGYDVYLSGAQAILTIEVPNARTNRELVLFRDSFGSSIAPYFTGAYRKITLVDMRYASSAEIARTVHWRNQDVLFLFSTALINNAAGVFKP